MKLNRQFDQLIQSPTVAVSDRVLALKAAGRRVIPLHVGDPDFNTPPAIVDAANQAIQAGLTHYSPSRGLLELREAIAAKLTGMLDKNSSGNLPYDPQSEIQVTHGGIHAYYLAMQSILNPGDEVVIPDPSWPTHANMIRQLRCSVVPVPAKAEEGFIPTIDAWEKALTPKTAALVIKESLDAQDCCAGD
jgi:aspartate/methionine/tyrosine aminotransferase